MRYRGIFLLSTIALAAVGCNHDGHDKGEEVIAERFIHKYGYDVPKDEWASKTYPGKVITTHRNGVTVTTHYEDGHMHGQRTRTFPHSQTHEVVEDYQRGTLVKRMNYDVRGIPMSESNFLSPSHTKTTTWYGRGTPKATEEMINRKLAYAEYFDPSNTLESKIENGSGIKTKRSSHGELISRTYFNNYAITQKETFHMNGIPHVSEFYENGLLNGPRAVFTDSGSPISQEQYSEGLLNGLATYYQNGLKYKETPYVQGQKEGIERHYIDGETLAEESEWHDDSRHGPSVVFYDGVPSTTWYYNNEKVSRTKYDDLCNREDELRLMNERAEMHKFF